MNKRFKYLVTCNLMQKRSRHVYLKCSKLGRERRYCIQVTMGKQHNTLYCRCLRIKNFSFSRRRGNDGIDLQTLGQKALHDTWLRQFAANDM